MIQATELRIGNYVFYKNKITIVDTIYYDIINMDLIDCDGIELNLLKPIEITFEIFFKLKELSETCEANELILNGVSFQLTSQGLVLKKWMYSYLYIPIQYLHELQNFVYLFSKKELKIKL